MQKYSIYPVKTKKITQKNLILQKYSQFTLCYIFDFSEKVIENLE